MQSNVRPHYVEFQLSPEQLQARLATLPQRPDFPSSEFSSATLAKARRAAMVSAKKKPAAPKPTPKAVNAGRRRRGRTDERLRLKAQGWLTQGEVRALVRRAAPTVFSVLRSLAAEHPEWHEKFGNKRYFHPGIVDLVKERLPKPTRKGEAVMQSLQLGRAARRVPPQAGLVPLADAIQTHGWPAYACMRYCTAHRIGVLKAGMRFVSVADIALLQQWRDKVEARRAQ